MGLSVNTNIAALNAYRNLSNTQNDLSKSLEKLSSGFRINRAADDAAGLAISEGMRSQIGGIKVGIRNAQDGISVVQTAEGALNETTSILQRMRDLTVQAGNLGSLTDEAKGNIQSEIDALTTTLDDIASNTKFNGKALLDGSFAVTGMTFQVGANNGETVDVTIGDMTATTLGVDGGTLTGISSTTTAAQISTNLTAIDDAIKSVSTQRAELGAKQNQFERVINNASVALENVTASESRIRDTDMAAEMVSFTRSQILSQAGTAMLAQAKSLPQGVLQLLQG
jgi:flagellin